MKSRILLAGLVVTATVIGFTGAAEAEGDGKDGYDQHSHDHDGHATLSGRTFAIKGEYLYVNAALVPPQVLKAGDTFLNCYTFEEDGIEDTLDSGVWVDPLFPAQGTWVQHSKGRVSRYTAYADSTDVTGLLLVQNGTVRPGYDKHHARLKAHSTVSVPAIGQVIATVLSIGYEVENDQVEDCLPPQPAD